jgi:predicted acylesterase/phospholipase RssA
MNIVVLPASGQNFVCQLAILQHLCDIDYKPDLMLGSSGGNLAAYLVAAADWNSKHIERLARKLKSHYFATPWSSIKMISGAVGFFNGNAFNTGYGLHEFMKTYFTNLSVLKYEIWTGIYNQDLQKFRLCCNRSIKNSLINCHDIDYQLTQSMNPYFCHGDIDKITDCGLASAAIPGVIKPVVIDGNKRFLLGDFIVTHNSSLIKAIGLNMIMAQSGSYVPGHHYSDGALYGASPLSVCQNIILKLTKQQPIHITYINSKDLSQANVKQGHNLFDTWIAAVNNLIKSQTLLDRLIAHELLFNNKNVDYIKFNCTYDNLMKNKEKRQNCRFTLLEIYPTKESDIDITNFTGDDVVKNIKLISSSCQCHFWWVD